VPRTAPSRALAAALAASLIALAGCDGTPDDEGAPPVPPVPCSAATATATTEVLISGMQFVPFCATVAAGVPLTFTNADAVEHTVTSDAGQPEPFESGLLFPGQQFTRALSTPGTVRVHDRLHPWMSGSVIVQ